MSNHKKSNGTAPIVAVPDHPMRSILAAVGIRPDRIGQPGFCTMCGRGVDDGATFAVERVGSTAELGRVELADVCDFCDLRKALTQFAGPIIEGIRRARMKAQSPNWRLVQTARDGAAWQHDLRKLRVIEDVGLASFEGRDRADRANVAGFPVIDVTPFGSVIVVKSLDGSREVHREKATDELVAAWTAGEIIGFGGPNGARWPDTVVRAVWDFNSRQGWRWWHHVSVSRADRRVPTYEELTAVRREFVTTARECYQIFPPEDRYVNLHPAVLHLWHCVDGSDGEPDTGRQLPRFEAEISGQKGRTLTTI